MPAALLAALILQATPETLAELERAYDQSCNGRLYGQQDDLCGTMEAQVKAYRAELKRRPPPKARPVAPAPAPSTVPLVDPPASHEPLAPATPKS